MNTPEQAEGRRDYIAHISGNRIQTVEEHCRNVAALASDNLKMFGLGKTGYLAGLLHDMGKYSDEFQEYIRITDPDEKKAKKGTVIHSFAAVRWLLRTSHHLQGCEGYDDVAAELISYASGAHHGLFDILDPSGPVADNPRADGFRHRMNRQPETDDISASRFFRLCASEDEIDGLFDIASLEIRAAVESIRKSIEAMKCEGKSKAVMYDFHIGLLSRLLLSAVIDADRTDAASFEGIRMPDNRGISWTSTEKEMDVYLRSLRTATPMSAARQEFSEVCRNAAGTEPGIFRLDMPTGAGKTLSGLGFAVAHAGLHDMKRIYYVAPLLSIIDQNETVFRKALPSVPVLAHHSDVTPEERRPTEDRNIQDLVKENWNNPAIVTTLARFLEALFGDSPSDIRRFRALCDSVILLDEVQSVPMKMIHPFNMAMNFLAGFCHSTVVLASATQPTFGDTDYPMDIRGNIVPSSLFEKYEKTFRRTRMIYAGSGTLEDAAGFVQTIASGQMSLLVVCNTKKEVETIYDSLPADYVKFHLSAAMCPAHRKVVLADIEDALSHHKRVVCVASQVIEAGVDISFGCVIRLAAGLDNAVQAAGRGNRHGESQFPVPVYIYVINNERLGPLDDIRASKDAFLRLESYLEEHPGLEMDSARAVAKYYGYRYENRSAKMSYAMEDTTMVDLLSSNRRTARKFGSVPWFLRQSFATAARLFEVYDGDQVPVVVPYGDGAEIIRRFSEKKEIRDLIPLIREARQYTVSVYGNMFRKLDEAGAIRVIDTGKVVVYCLAGGFYDMEKGVVTCGTTMEY